MDEAKVTVLYDEGALEGTTYIGGRGLSIMVDVDGERTLFGAGRRPRYLSNNLYNAAVEPSSITRVVVSHHHPDQWAGLPGLLRERDSPVEVYATASAWGVKKALGCTGLFVSDEYLDKVVRKDVSDWVQLSEHLFISAPLPFHEGEGEEIFVVIKTLNGPVLLSGCCHCGLDHIFDAVKDKFGSYPIALIGGLHCEGRKNKALAGIYANYIQQVGCRQLYLNHCTGQDGINQMRTVLGLKGVSDFYTGQSLTFRVF